MSSKMSWHQLVKTVPFQPRYLVNICLAYPFKTHKFWITQRFFTILLDQMLLALHGTMIMEIQPISSCAAERRNGQECRRTVAHKVRSQRIFQTPIMWDTDVTNLVPILQTAQHYQSEYHNSSLVTARRHNSSLPYSRCGITPLSPTPGVA